jgi:hypothetical protein
MFFERSFELVRAFVIQDVEIGSIAIRLKAGMECRPGLSELAGLAGLDRLGEDGVTIIVVEHHDIIVASRRLDWEFSGLIRVGFVEID